MKALCRSVGTVLFPWNFFPAEPRKKKEKSPVLRRVVEESQDRFLIEVNPSLQGKKKRPSVLIC